MSKLYLLAITVSLCVTYFLLIFIYSAFFQTASQKITKRSMFSLGLIALLSILGYALVFRIPDPEWGNRILHGFGGGFMAFLVCFLVARDSRPQVTKFQFWFFSMLIVTSLGVANEILEFSLQNIFDLPIFAKSVNDTWLDLVSNTIGALIASVCFVPFVKTRSSKSAE